MTTDIREALGEALSFVESEVRRYVVLNLEWNAAELAKAIQASYDQFFQKLQYYVLETGLPADSSGYPPLLQMVKAQAWKGESDSWMDRKNQAFDKGDKNALDFYRGVTAILGSGKRRPKVPLHTYIGKLASTPGSTEKFFGDMSLIFIETQPDGRTRTFRTAADLHSKFRPGEARNKRGQFTKFMEGTTLRAEITAFPKIEKVLATRSNPDMELVDFLAKSDPNNRKQWIKFSGQKEWHRPAVIPMIQWYLEVEFKRLADKHVFFGGLT